MQSSALLYSSRDIARSSFDLLGSLIVASVINASRIYLIWVKYIDFSKFSSVSETFLGYTSMFSKIAAGSSVGIDFCFAFFLHAIKSLPLFFARLAIVVSISWLMILI